MKKVKYLFVGAAILLLILTAIMPVNALFLKKKDENTQMYSPMGNSLTWKKTFGQGQWISWFSSIQQTTDGGYISAGMLNKDFWLVKIDENGNMQWQKTYGGNDKDLAYHVQQTSDSGYILIGVATEVDLHHPYVDGKILLIKTDAAGNKEWEKTFEKGYETFSRSVQQTSDGGYIIAGSIDIYDSPNERDAWLIKTDSNGNIEWEKIFDKSDYDSAEFVQQTSDGGYIFTGTLGHWPDETAWLCKTDAAGNEIWNKTYEDPGGISTNGIYVQQTTGGGYIVLVQFEFEVVYDWFFVGDMWLIKTYENGETEWDKKCSRTIGAYSGSSVQQTADGGYILTGFFGTSVLNYCDLFLLKTDSSGNKMWERIYGTSGTHMDGGFDCHQTTDGGYIIAGCKVANPYLTLPEWKYKNWVIKTDGNGNVDKGRAKSINSGSSDLLTRFPLLFRLLPLFNRPLK